MTRVAKAITRAALWLGGLASVGALASCSAAEATLADAGALDGRASDGGLHLDGGQTGAALKHRASPEICPQTRGPGQTRVDSGACTTDTDCADGGANGRCYTSPCCGLINSCSYDECFADTDCTGGAPCACRSIDNANTCMGGSNCRVDGDCGPGGFCSPSEFNCLGQAYFCHTAKDGCVNDADCAVDGGGASPLCLYDPSAKAWSCRSACAPP